MWGFTQELFDSSANPKTRASPEASQGVQAEVFAEMATLYPNIAAIATSTPHDDSVVGHGCDDQFEFEFALDVLLDGFEHLQRREWTSPGRRNSGG